MTDNNPNNTTSSAYEYSEDVLEFLALLLEEYLQQQKLNKSPPE